LGGLLLLGEAVPGAQESEGEDKKELAAHPHNHFL
jgi:hypothetical protein